MAMEKPIVSTAVGAEGIPCTPDEHIVFADSPAAFARATSSLLCDKQQQQRLGTNASIWVRKTFDWAILQKSIDAGLDSYIT
jgi:glycosyltransferase involved in cell wall biosynthesis